MPIAKVIEITSESPNGYDDAVSRGVQEASKTIDRIQSAWVKDHEVLIGPEGRPESHRVDLKVTFLVSDEKRA